MRNNKQVHVVPNSDRGGWDIKKPGNDRSSKHFTTKDQAVERAREISRNQSGELVIHRKDGTIQKRDSHGNDPFPPRG